MKLHEHLLTILAQDCANVTFRAGEAIMFGLLERESGHKLDNAERIVDEFHDIVATMILMEQHGIIPLAFPSTAELEERLKEKIIRIEAAKKFSAIDS